MTQAIQDQIQIFDHGSRRQRVVREILVGLFTGRFEVGQRMRVESLAEQFEVSATPVREALVELAGVGIVDLQPNRGAVLRPFGAEEIKQIVQVRRILECEAVRTSCDRFAPYELASLEQELLALNDAPRDAVWAQKTRELDSRLHNLIAERCGSDRLALEIGRYAVLFNALRDALTEKRPDGVGNSYAEENAEHLVIVRTLAARDPAAAVAAMAYHINQAAKVLLKELFGAEE
ncbi:GntR family transcriptional regulator [Planctomicrobium sp. SH668]|uniref:GntR family transcriptional regulator n=1 Tax=Planctomicrobium sp. SH668 TaxID=3448126 RepID=UPI003F5AFBF6